jgi:1,4-dihydroxy-2-naphthoyl-CoA hydrolase
VKNAMNETARTIWRPGVTLEALRNRAKNTLSTHLGIELVELGPDYVRATMPVDQRTCQPMGILHGGASVVLAETLGSFGANQVIERERFACVGQEINANHLRPALLGETVTGTARPFHIGARSQVWGIEIVNEQGKLVCVSRITMAVIRRPQRAVTGEP